MEKLKKYINQIRGVSYKPIDSSNELKEGYIPLLRANNINNGKINFDNIIYVKEEKVKSIQYLKKGDILICTSSGSKELVGKAGLIKENCNATFGAFCKVIRLKEGYDYNYFNHFFQSNYYKKMIQKSSNGSNINNLKTENFDNLNVNILEIHFQTKIANKLDKVQEIIDIREKQTEQLDELIKSQFVEMFENKKYPKDEFINLSKEIYAGGDKPKDISQIKKEEYLYPVFANGYENEGLQGYSKNYRTEDESITISARGTIGYCFIRQGNFTPIVRLITIVPNERVNVIYLKYAIDNLNIVSSGTNQAQLTVPNIKKHKIIVPPIDLQNKFAEFVKQIDKQKIELQKSLEEIQKLKESLMNKYFGE